MKAQQGKDGTSSHAKSFQEGVTSCGGMDCLLLFLQTLGHSVGRSDHGLLLL